MTGKEEFEEVLAKIDDDFAYAWNEIVRLAENNVVEAMEFVAFSFYRGEHIEMDEPLALIWFKRIVERYPTNGFIWNKLGDCYYWGYGTKKDQKKAIGYYMKAWENGIADAATDIGWINAYGDIVEHNDIIAAKWFQRGADMGSTRGMYFLGYFYAEGYGGLPISEKMALKYLEAAAQAGNLSAITFLLAKKCYGNNGRFEYWREELKKIAEKGNDDAQYSLGMAYILGKEWEYGYGLEQDFIEAEKWLKLSAEKENEDALYELGKGLIDYDSGFFVDMELGEQYLLKAAGKGKTDAYSELSRYYKIRKDDTEKSLFWAEKAIKCGKRYMAYDVANSYFKGEGIRINYVKAAEYFLICISEEPEGVYAKLSYLPLAKCYFLDQNLGRGKYQDTYKYLNLALCAANTERYCEDTKGEIEYWLAYMFDNGLGVTKNLEEAYKHYSKSYELGYDKAREQLSHFKKSLFGWKKI